MATLRIRSQDDAQRMVEAIRDGVKQEDGSFVQLTPDQKEMGVAGLRQYAAERQEAVDFREKQRDPVTGKIPDKPDLQVIDPSADRSQDPTFGSDLRRRGAGAFQVGLTLATGAVAEPLAGALGIWELAGTDGTFDSAADMVAAWSDALTFQPRTETGKDMLGGLMVPLAKIDEGADWIATNASFGNVFAATAIKTALLGGLEIAGMKGTARVRTPRALADLQKAAADMGIKLDANNMQSSILEAAQKMTPERRAENAGFLQEAMRIAAEESRKSVDTAFAKAREGRAFVDVESVQELSAHMKKELLEEGYTFGGTEMKGLLDRFESMDNFGSERPGTAQIQGLQGEPLSANTITQNVKDLELVRRQLVKDGRSSDANVRSASGKMKGMIDDWMDHQLANDLIGGDPAVIQLWKDARLEHTDYMKNFKADRMIKNMIEMESTPEQVRAWITGMNAIGGRANAAVTVNRLKEVLGENHPAIEGIRQDLLYEVASPLLAAKPNFGRFISNYDNLIAKHDSLVKSLGLDKGNLKQLRDFAVTAEKIPPNQSVLSLGGLTRGLSQFFVGHHIARAALRVNLTRNIANLFFGIDRVSKKSILFDLTQAAHGTPMLHRTSAAAGVFIASSALSEAEAVVAKDRKKTAEAAAHAAAQVQGRNPLL